MNAESGSFADALERGRLRVVLAMIGFVIAGRLRRSRSGRLESPMVGRRECVGCRQFSREENMEAFLWLCWLRQSSARAAPNNSRAGCAPVSAALCAAELTLSMQTSNLGP